MLYPPKLFRFIRPVHVLLKTDKWDYLRWPMTDQIFFFNVLALENILVALTREIGDGPCFLYIKFSWIGVVAHMPLRHPGLACLILPYIFRKTVFSTN